MSETSLMKIRETLKQNLAYHKEEIQKALTRSSHRDREVTLVAVTKRHSQKMIDLLSDLNHLHIGESYVGDSLEKEQSLDERAKDFTWHLIGHLQRNKVKKALPLFSLIHSVDSLRLMKKIEKEGKKISQVTSILLQINVSGEESKYGFSPENIFRALDLYSQLEFVKIEGLMTMAPYIEAEETRPYFSRLREVRDKVQPSFPEIQELSMGMSNDYRVAVEEGATLVRLGTALFKGIPPE